MKKIVRNFFIRLLEQSMTFTNVFMIFTVATTLFFVYHFLSGHYTLEQPAFFFQEDTSKTLNADDYLITITRQDPWTLDELSALSADLEVNLHEEMNLLSFSELSKKELIPVNYEKAVVNGDLSILDGLLLSPDGKTCYFSVAADPLYHDIRKIGIYKDNLYGFWNWGHIRLGGRYIVGETVASALKKDISWQLPLLFLCILTVFILISVRNKLALYSFIPPICGMFWMLGGYSLLKMPYSPYIILQSVLVTPVFFLFAFITEKELLRSYKPDFYQSRRDWLISGWKNQALIFILLSFFFGISFFSLALNSSSFQNLPMIFGLVATGFFSVTITSGLISKRTVLSDLQQQKLLKPYFFDSILKKISKWSFRNFWLLFIAFFLLIASSAVIFALSDKSVNGIDILAGDNAVNHDLTFYRNLFPTMNTEVETAVFDTSLIFRFLPSLIIFLIAGIPSLFLFKSIKKIAVFLSPGLTVTAVLLLSSAILKFPINKGIAAVFLLFLIQGIFAGGNLVFFGEKSKGNWDQYSRSIGIIIFVHILLNLFVAGFLGLSSLMELKYCALLQLTGTFAILIVYLFSPSIWGFKKTLSEGGK